MDYIESELARRYQNDHPSDVPSAGPSTNEAAGGSTTSNSFQREPATLGKLHEIDLGQETRLQNIKRTQAATKRLGRGDEPVPEDDVQRNRSGRGGQTLRNGKGRNSEDIERDRLVEEVLRESKRMFLSLSLSVSLCLSLLV